MGHLRKEFVLHSEFIELILLLGVYEKLTKNSETILSSNNVFWLLDYTNALPHRVVMGDPDGFMLHWCERGGCGEV